MKCYLRFSTDTINEAKRYPSKARAIQVFRTVADELYRYGQRIEASLHYARNQDELDEYPDFTLRLGRYGGVVCEKA